jgi:hypothetical protein
MLFSFVMVVSKRFPESIAHEISHKQLRNPVIKLGACMGMLCSLFLTMYFFSV